MGEQRGEIARSGSEPSHMNPQSKATITARRSDISAFRRLRKTAKSDCWLRHVCLLSVRMEQLGSPEQKFMKFVI